MASFSALMRSDRYQTSIHNYISDKGRAERFTADIISMVTANPALADCTPGSLLAGAILGESLGLSHSPIMGHYYLIPFECKKKDASGRAVRDANGKYVTENRAQFVMGYKGYSQLAVRSGEISRLVSIEIKEEEFRSFDPITETLDAIIITDPDAREAAPTAGYYGFFVTRDGFMKQVYMTRSQMERYADKYSKAFKLDIYRKMQRGEIPENEMWKYSSFWYKDFDTMARKTIIRRLVTSGCCPVSAEMSTAVSSDTGVMTFDDNGLLTPDNTAEAADQSDTNAPDTRQLAPDAPSGESGTLSLDDL